MGNDKRISIESLAEDARVGLAKERDRAIERFNQLNETTKRLAQQYQQIQQDMVRWCISILRTVDRKSVTVSSGDLVESDNWVLRRVNDPEEGTVTWDIVTKEEHEREVAEAEAAAKLAVEQELVDKVQDIIEEDEATPRLRIVEADEEDAAD